MTIKESLLQQIRELDTHIARLISQAKRLQDALAHKRKQKDLQSAQNSIE